MDGVELSMPAIVVSKLLAADGFGRVDKSEARGSIGAGASTSGSIKAPDHDSYGQDIKHPLTISGCSSVFKSKKANANRCMRENIFSSYKSEENGDTHNTREDKPILLTPKLEGKQLNRKSVKKLSCFPCPKRSRADQSENSRRIAGADVLDIISEKFASDVIPFTCPEKSLLLKKKRCQDGMRTDKRNYRATMRTKSFTSKAGFTGSDSASGGNIVPGIYGLKSDLRDFTKHVDELSVNELLDGNCKYPKTCPDKGKRAPNANENILLSVTKACSVLPSHRVVDSNGSKKGPLSLPNSNSCPIELSDSDDKEKHVEETMASIKIQDSCQANLDDSILYQPKYIQERLGLHPVHNVDALSNLSTTSLPLQPSMTMATYHASLPPFPWSFSHSGSWKLSVDSVKLSSTRNTCQSRWVRVESNSTSIGDDKSCFSESELKIFDYKDSVNQQKIDDLLQYVKSLNEPVEPPIDAPLSTSRSIPSLPEVSLGCEGNESSLEVSQTHSLHFEESEFAQKQQHTGITHFRSDYCYGYPSKGAADECDQSSQRIAASEISEQGHSPRRVAAAEILCKMARHSKSIEEHKQSSGRGKSPTALPAKNKAEAWKASSHICNPVKSMLMQSSVKHKSMSERKDRFTHESSICRGGNESPRLLERDLHVPPRLLHGNVSLRQDERECGTEQKLRRMSMKSSSSSIGFGVGGTYIKDWKRGRSKRMV